MPRRVVEIDVPAAEAELAADVLWRADPSAVSEVDLGDGRVRLTADVCEAVADLPGSWTMREVELHSDQHLDMWRAWAHPVRAGRRIVVQPAWLAPDDGSADDVVLLLDPGRAFGSGSHPSTRLVLATLEDVLVPGDRVLDVGTGSGVLAVAACLLGASAVVALDVDPAAVDATSANASVNGVADRISVSTALLAAIDDAFDVVVANIGSAVLRALADDLARVTSAGGVLVLSGLLEDQVTEVLSRFSGFTELARPIEEGWAAAVLRAPA